MLITIQKTLRTIIETQIEFLAVSGPIEVIFLFFFLFQMRLVPCYISSKGNNRKSTLLGLVGGLFPLFY